MATFVQFIDGQPLRMLTVIGGDSASLRQLALDELIARVEPEEVIYSDAAEENTKALLMKLAEPDVLVRSRMVVYKNVQLEGDWLRRLDVYLADPSPNVFLTLIADRVRDENKKRWIPSDKRVLYIDCNELTPEATQRYCEVEGLTPKDAEWLVDRCAADIDVIVRYLDLFAVFDEPESKTIREIVSTDSLSDSLAEKFVIRFAYTDAALTGQIKKRLHQLIVISENIDARLPIQELAQRAGCHQFVAGRLVSLARTKRANYWFRMLAEVIRMETYSGMTGYRECLRRLLV